MKKAKAAPAEPQYLLVQDGWRDSGGSYEAMGDPTTDGVYRIRGVYHSEAAAENAMEQIVRTARGDTPELHIRSFKRWIDLEASNYLGSQATDDGDYQLYARQLASMAAEAMATAPN